MTEITVLEIAKNAMIVGLQVSAPLLMVSLVTGTTLGVLMAATQVQEFTLTFVPKLLAMGAILLLAGPWMLRSLVAFTISIFDKIPGITQ